MESAIVVWEDAGVVVFPGVVFDVFPGGVDEEEQEVTFTVTHESGSTLNPQPLTPQPSTLKPKPSTLNPNSYTLNPDS